MLNGKVSDAETPRVATCVLARQAGGVRSQAGGAFPLQILGLWSNVGKTILGQEVAKRPRIGCLGRIPSSSGETPFQLVWSFSDLKWTRVGTGP